MGRSARGWWGVVIAIGVILVGGVDGQEKKPSEKHDAGVLNETLREVIDAGAKIFNDNGDHAGCYHLWRGALMSIRPFVPPDLQTAIASGLASAEKKETYADRAFELRRVLDDVRSKTSRPVTGKTPGDDKEKSKKPGEVDKKKKEKNKEKGTEKGKVVGRLHFLGKPVLGGYFVTLVAEDGRAFSSAIQKDGSFQFKTPIPIGDYLVAVEPIPSEEAKVTVLPTKYQAANTSNLSVRVQGGEQTIDLNLVK